MDADALQKLIRLTYTGLTDGSLLALIALGLVLVYKATDVINFAHGEFMLLGGFIGYQILLWTTEGTGGVSAETVNLLLPVVLGVLFILLILRRRGERLLVLAMREVSGTVSAMPWQFYTGALLLVIVLFIASKVLFAVASMMLIMLFIGVVLERIVLRPLIGEPIISVIMVTIGLSNIIHGIVGLIWGNNPVRLPQEVVPDTLLSESGRFELYIEGARRPMFMDHESLIVMFIVFLLTGLLIGFFRYSKHGIAMRATADDQQAAMRMGISIKVVFAMAWSLAAMTAAVAGLMIGEISSLSSAIPVVGLRAFPVIILGGLDSIAGAIIGGLAIGLTEQFASGYIDPSVKSVAPYVVLLIMMMVRPYGLFGQKIIERV